MYHVFLLFLSFVNSIFNSSRKAIRAHAYLLYLYSSIKQVATPSFLHQLPPFSGLSPLSSKVFGTSPKWINFSYSPHPFNKGEGFQLCNVKFFGPNLPKYWILGSEFQTFKSRFGISTTKIPPVPIFCQNGQYWIFLLKFWEIPQLRAIFLF